MKRILLSLLLAVVAASGSEAGKYNPTVDVGQKLTAWNDLPGVDGKKHSWEDVADKKAVVVFFTSNTCPYAVDYESRIKQLADRFAKDDRVALVGINSNLVEEDSLEEMRKRAEELGFEFPYLKDETQQLGKDWGATRTPEFFVLNSDREVVYMGALDNDTNAEEATVNYVEVAVDALLKGENPEVQETVPIGCNIRYRRTRR